MTHKEFKLIVKKEIMESVGINLQFPYHKIGDEVVVDELTFEKIQSGSTIERYTRNGIVMFDKYSFENEVEFTSVTVEYGIRKLGQRKTATKE